MSTEATENTTETAKQPLGAVLAPLELNSVAARYLVNSCSDTLICCVCSGVPLDAYEILCTNVRCGHVYCHRCLKSWFQQLNHTTCPRCSSVVENQSIHPASRALRLQISHLEINCPLDCPSTFMIGHDGETVRQHMKSCINAPVPCPDCTAHVRRCELSDHRMSCEYRIVLCPYCGDSMQARELNTHCAPANPRLGCINFMECIRGCTPKVYPTNAVSTDDDSNFTILKCAEVESHRAICAMEPVACGVNDCKSNLPRKDVDQHRQNCPHRTVSCIFCNDQMQAHALHDHQNVNKPIGCINQMICPNQCKDEKNEVVVLLKKDLAIHIDVCPNQTISCKVCGHAVLRCESERHAQSFATQHVARLSDQLKDAKAKISEWESTGAALLKRIESLESKVTIQSGTATAAFAQIEELKAEVKGQATSIMNKCDSTTLNIKTQLSSLQTQVDKQCVVLSPFSFEWTIPNAKTGAADQCSPIFYYAGYKLYLQMQREKDGADENCELYLVNNSEHEIVVDATLMILKDDQIASKYFSGKKIPHGIGWGLAMASWSQLTSQGITDTVRVAVVGRIHQPEWLEKSLKCFQS